MIATTRILWFTNYLFLKIRFNFTIDVEVSNLILGRFGLGIEISSFFRRKKSGAKARPFTGTPTKKYLFSLRPNLFARIVLYTIKAFNFDNRKSA